MSVEGLQASDGFDREPVPGHGGCSIRIAAERAPFLTPGRKAPEHLLVDRKRADRAAMGEQEAWRGACPGEQERWERNEIEIPIPLEAPVTKDIIILNLIF